VLAVGLPLGAIAIGLRQGWKRGLLLLPAIGEELVFRVLLLPSALEGVPLLAMVPWMALSVGLFVAWHGIRIRPRSGQPHLNRAAPAALLRLTLLGTACALAFALSGSLWPPVWIHWLALVGGQAQRRIRDAGGREEVRLRGLDEQAEP
jgi:predicted Abi (CAAX) family protease